VVFGKNFDLLKQALIWRKCFQVKLIFPRLKQREKTCGFIFFFFKENLLKISFIRHLKIVVNVVIQ
jgi:hypothetical protein